MTKSRILYAAIVLAAFIFSQALYDPISLFVLVCVILLPIVSLLMLLICRSSFRVRSRLAREQVYRYRETKLFVELMSGAPFLSPVVTLNCVLNNPEGDRSAIRRLPLAFSPFSKTVIEIPVSYTLRGKYDVGIRSVEICDFLRLFRIKVKLNQMYILRVTPRFLPSDLRISQDIFLEDGSSTDMLATNGYGAELFGVRDYQDNDSLRHVHWNLSAVKDNLMVKTFSINRQKQICVLLDMSDPNPASPESRRLADALVETAVSLSRDYLDRVGGVNLMWHTGAMQQCDINSPQHLSTAYEKVAFCPMQPMNVMNHIADELTNVQALCMIVGDLNEEKRTRIEIIAGVVRCPIRLLAFNNSADVSDMELRGKNISLEMLHIETVEGGRIA